MTAQQKMEEFREDLMCAAATKERSELDMKVFIANSNYTDTLDSIKTLKKHAESSDMNIKDLLTCMLKEVE